MGENTKIEWAHHTFNPWVGCAKVSEGCRNCYAEALAKRGGLATWGPEGTRHRTTPDYWKQAFRWDAKAMKAGERQRVFCASMADVFESHADVLQARADLFDVIKNTPCLDWLLLTKRPENFVQHLPKDWGEGYPNVWLGVSVENQEQADWRIPILVRTPAVVKFLSCEPLLGPIMLQKAELGSTGGWIANPNEPDDFLYWIARDNGIKWVIVGGESGPRARPMHPDWARSLRDQCEKSSVYFFFKQWGEYTAVRIGPSKYEMKKVGKKNAGRVLDGETWDEVPTRS